MCGITINSQEGSDGDEKINDLKLKDGKRAAMVSRRVLTICLIMMLKLKSLICSYLTWDQNKFSHLAIMPAFNVG